MEIPKSNHIQNNHAIQNKISITLEPRKTKEMHQHKSSIYFILNLAIGAVWLINGLFCKILNLVPRHQEIVSSILGSKYASILTIMIGIAEIIMAFWVWSKFKSRWNTIIQILIVATMNIIEIGIVPDLLLWGKTNALYALIFIGIVYTNEFHLKPSKT